MTNAERIRNMTDDELAVFLTKFKNTFGEEYEGEKSCLDWLQSEAEQEENMEECEAIEIMKGGGIDG